MAPHTLETLINEWSRILELMHKSNEELGKIKYEELELEALRIKSMINTYEASDARL